MNTAGKTAMSEYRGDSANVNWKGCVCKKKENRNTVGEQEWCLAMREARKRNSSHEPYFSRNQRHIPGWESPFRERVSLLVRFKSWEVPSKMMTRGLENVFVSPTAVREVSLGKSIHQFISSSPLRMINSLESSSSLKLNACLPNRMEVNSDKSIHHSLSGRFTLKHNAMTVIKCTITKQEWFQMGHV